MHSLLETVLSQFSPKFPKEPNRYEVDWQPEKPRTQIYWKNWIVDQSNYQESNSFFIVIIWQFDVGNTAEEANNYA